MYGNILFERPQLRMI